jgi:hypothetical protein
VYYPTIPLGRSPIVEGRLLTKQIILNICPAPGDAVMQFQGILPEGTHVQVSQGNAIEIYALFLQNV